ncbi:MAG: formate--tetrahydrofolate ligase [Gammaproteobacteria bacterium]|jgi:formate--tetrahydrofolate ligase|nr:formate--tetrahydrofolate ligase [Gammaproteobacteria bacterium]MBT4461998.1 formate--tetrahydrofolate ligase [Gammaproteobacteria bacterium]MBT4654510.1 formate--tetrahydrofolate ligase [Gammaproteobacteria bacterium]MBT5116772.1 formate--tetrahydrofolate ligase [Gammaproteobacteria bacterium]MBT5761451.1 formate--tetrahydrofolate ligase [Gammaproteobacteria bacterium]
MKSDIEIAQAAELEKISSIAKKLDIPEDSLEPYGHYKAKISLDFLKSLDDKRDGKLILVTAISPTPAGEGKTTTSVGLGDALNQIGKKALITIREPSLGPVFGMKGGAAGGGMAQVIPMEDINLHFTGDFNAIQLANNLLSAMLDNHIHHGNKLNIDVRRVTWKRVLDMNDRALRKTVCSLGSIGNGYPREDGFDIVVASEVMAIFCLATSLADLKERLGDIVIAYTRDREPILARQINAHGAMTVLLKDAVMPNLVQTLENNPAIIHGGPFANIAHGCNSVIATKASLKLADYVVTEAGFGADLGAEKFLDIKCRKAGLTPSVVVLVATIRALKYHGGCSKEEFSVEGCDYLKKGLVNLERHVKNLKKHYGLPVVVGINGFASDTDAERKILQDKSDELDVPIVSSTHHANGGDGAKELAETVVKVIDEVENKFKFLYEDDLDLWSKMETIAQKIYGASGISAPANIKKQIDDLQKNGYGKYPVCVAKTQYSFSTDPTLRGAPSGHEITIREVRLAAGAEFIVMVCGDIMTMPGLPKIPAAEKIDLDDDGNIIGLF